MPSGQLSEEGSLLSYPSRSECFEGSEVVVGKHLEVALLWRGVEWRVVEDVPGTIGCVLCWEEA